MDRNDLSEYKTLIGLMPDVSFDKVLNVGWLSKEVDFETREPSKKFVEALRYLVSTSFVNAERGYDHCPLCLPTRPKDFKNFTFPEHESFTNIYGEEKKLGNSEVWVNGEEETYAAPNLIFHYVTHHHYLPPEVFISAVIKNHRIHQQENKL